ncbi:MAG: holo-ACP synthase [Thermoanaerobacteraceae bacterium]|nr:holo-ACP synthase [Thermoanaerobacteraceae bacterium]
MAGIGVDIIEINRIERLLSKWRGKFTGRVFSDRELEYCMKKKRPAPSLAARFAAKEAALKAMGRGLGACPLKEIEVINQPGGKPKLVLTGKARELAEDLGISCWQVSLSHSKSHAVAVVMAE